MTCLVFRRRRGCRVHRYCGFVRAEPVGIPYNNGNAVSGSVSEIIFRLDKRKLDIGSEVTIHTYARFRINLRLSSVNCNDDAHKMPKNRHFGAGSDTMQQVHGAGVNSNDQNFMEWTSISVSVAFFKKLCYSIANSILKAMKSDSRYLEMLQRVPLAAKGYMEGYSE